jgi:hypothetical protein
MWSNAKSCLGVSLGEMRGTLEVQERVKRLAHQDGLHLDTEGAYIFIYHNTAIALVDSREK